MAQSRIQRLDEKTARKIAAGEVVEKPATVVKELVENAIDAGANEIIVDIKKGGKSLIRVTDNGSGIHYDDLPLVFERHATSKIRSIEDLYATHSLGFRGEALASISAVSQVELITMNTEATIGKKVIASGGQIHKVSEIGTVQGTTLHIRDLFFNTPARLKFLKSDQAEGRAITELMSYLALSHPEIAFKYSVDDKLIFHTPGKGKISDVIFTVFEPMMLKGLYEINETSENHTLTGYISRFDYTKGTRNHQLLFVNGRYVKSDLLKDVIHMAYKPYMMHNRYPVCILFLDIAPSDIDVNIHPAKTEIKFKEDGAVKQFIFTALKKAFNLYDQVPTATFTEKQVFRVEETAKAQIEAIQEMPLSIPPETVPTYKKDTTHKPTGASTYTPTAKPESIDFSGLTQFAQEVIPVETPKPIEVSIYEGLHYIGVYNLTYLIFEKEASLYLIDQHAAHEKILYEAYMMAFSNHTLQRQMLLIPEAIDLTALEMETFQVAIPLLEQMGFGVETFGAQSIVIREIPSQMGIGMAKKMVLEVLDGSVHLMDDAMASKLAERACKAAIKAHDTLHDMEVMALIESLKTLKDPYTCPHGRPIIIRFALSEIDRKFKRIL